MRPAPDLVPAASPWTEFGPRLRRFHRMKTTIATVIAFGANGDAARYQRGGWSVPEDGFAWTLDDSSTLELPAVDAPFGFFVELQLNPLIRPAIPRQRLILSVDGITIGTEEIRHSGLYAFYCPPSQGLDGFPFTDHRPSRFLSGAANRTMHGLRREPGPYFTAQRARDTAWPHGVEGTGCRGRRRRTRFRLANRRSCRWLRDVGG